VAELNVTVCPAVYVPAPGLNPGAATVPVTTYAADAMPLSIHPPSYAIARTVIVVELGSEIAEL